MKKLSLLFFSLIFLYSNILYASGFIVGEPEHLDFGNPKQMSFSDGQIWSILKLR